MDAVPRPGHRSGRRRGRSTGRWEPGARCPTGRGPTATAVLAKVEYGATRPERMDDVRAAAGQDVLVGEGDDAQEGQDRVDAAGMDEDRVGQLGHDADVGLPGGPEVTHQRGALALEHRHQPGDGPLHRLLEHDVGLVEAGRGAVPE